MKKVATRKPPHNFGEKSWKKAALWSVIGLLLIVILYFALSPARVSGTNKYITSGDDFLKNRKFISALVEYRKAAFLAGSSKANERTIIARESEKDITKLEPFFREINDIDALNDLSEANKVPQNESEAVKDAKAYIENGRPDLAILVATTATEMDENYADAWIYLGLANYYMMKDAEISGESREFYRGKAEESWQKARLAEPTNENVTKYLDELNK
ncbi:MAG: hypothetical protein WC080_03300 [Patescibacteria group bacterium]